MINDTMDYIQLNCKIQSENLTLFQELLMHELANIGFESFVETGNGLSAYIEAVNFKENLVKQISFPDDLMLGSVEYTSEFIHGQNWNQEWEKNFQPVLIASRCYIRAPFHNPKDVAYEIVIEPKMSFGTGHHETTSLMIEQMLSIPFEGKNVLDMGCGTGVLSIMASKLKAKSILAIDIDEWAYENTIENCQRNIATNVTAMMGDIDLISEKQFDIILANINRNILLKQISHYAHYQSKEGLLLLSGIYLEDLPMIQKCAENHTYEFLSVLKKNNWIAVLFTKK
jgi:ribosomal protein L11 methyltransferase